MENYIIYPKQLRRQQIPIEKNRCFFLMPFSDDFDGIYGAIKQCLNDAEFICNRADEISGSTPIITKILTEIMKSQYIIVDLTDSNPNVFYELGIAHTIKEARNVLLLKQKNYKVPFDISHLTYTEYDPHNIKLLTSYIRSFLKENKSKNDFYDALCRHGIINYFDENNNEFIEFLLSKLPNNTIQQLTDILLGEDSEFSQDKINDALMLLRNVIAEAFINCNYSLISKLIDIYYKEIQLVYECDAVREHVNNILYHFYEQFDIKDSDIREYRTRLALLLANKEMYMDIVMPWILNYFSRSKTATIDLNRYSVESFLMSSNSLLVNNAIINSLCNKDCYVREHMSDIIGEKRLISGATLLYIQLAKEDNYFTAQSMMEAIGKLNQPGGIEVIEQWVEKHKKNIINTNQLFVLKHAMIAIAALDNTSDQIHVGKFKDEFGAALKDYYIV